MVGQLIDLITCAYNTVSNVERIDCLNQAIEILKKLDGRRVTARLNDPTSGGRPIRVR